MQYPLTVTVYRTALTTSRNIPESTLLKDLLGELEKEYSCLDEGATGFLSISPFRLSEISTQQNTNIFSMLIQFTKASSLEEALQASNASAAVFSTPHYHLWDYGETLSTILSSITISAGHSIILYLIPSRYIETETSPHVSKRPKLTNNREEKDLEASNASVEYSNISANLPTCTSGDSVITGVSEQEKLAEDALGVYRLLKRLQRSCLCDPKEVSVIPLPTLNVPSALRDLDGVSKTDGHPSIIFRGRPAVGDLVTKLLVYPPVELAFHATSGAGARYITIAAAAALLGDGKPTIWYQCAQTPRLRPLISSILLACVAARCAAQTSQSTTSDDSTEAVRTGEGSSACPNLATIPWDDIITRLFVFTNKDQNLRGVRHFMRWAVTNHGLSFTLILDDFDTIAEGDRQTFLDMAEGHTLLLSGSPNCDFLFDRHLNGKKVVRFPLQPGLTEVEIAGWKSSILKENGTLLCGDDLDQIFDLTSAVPFLVQHVLETVRKKGTYTKDLVVGSDILTEKIGRSLKSYCQDRLPSFYEIYTAAIAEREGPYAYRDTYYSPDREYLYFDHQQQGWMVPSLLHKHALYLNMLRLREVTVHLQLDDWFHLMSRTKGNWASHGFAVEGATMAAIALYGLKIAVTTKAPNRKTRTLVHASIPSGLPIIIFSQTGIPTITDRESGHLLIPAEPNYRYIDGAVVFYNKEKKTVRICPLQVSMVKKKEDHSDSCSKFFEEDWKAWVQAVKVPSGWKVEWHFVWILQTTTSEVTTVNRTNSPLPTSGQPKYQEFVVGFPRQVSAALRKLK